MLNPKERAKCNITAGFAFTTEPNGACIKSEFGNYIVISEALRYFLYFMNIFHLGTELSTADRMTCLIIAARVMYYYEQLDFELDPRGIIPNKLQKQVQKVTQDQIRFVIGHEYFHHILNHLDAKSIANINMLPTTTSNPVAVFNHSQIQELQADFASVHRPSYSKTERNELLSAAFLFFMSLDLFGCIKSYYSPSIRHYKTHPEPLDRMWELRKKISPKLGMNTEQLHEFLESNAAVKKHLQEDWLPFNVEKFEMVGSHYLSSYIPGQKLDRIHY
jgi:hypothetical protein